MRNCLPYLNIANSGIRENTIHMMIMNKTCQPQSASSRELVHDQYAQDNVLVHMAALMTLNGSSVKKGNIERGTAKVHGRKEKTGKVQLRYIDDIHVIDVSFASQTM